MVNFSNIVCQFHGDNEDFESAIEMARRGEQKDLGILLDVYRGYLLTNASKRLARDVIAKVAPSDVVQEALLQASRSFDEFRGSTELELRTWLKTILVRKVIDAHRHYRRFAMRDVSREVPLIEEHREKLTCSQSSGSGSRLEVLAETLALLNNEQRKAIQLRSFDRLPFEDVGKHLGRSTEAARKIWTRAVQKIAQEFRSYESGTRPDGASANRLI